MEEKKTYIELTEYLRLILAVIEQGDFDELAQLCDCKDPNLKRGVTLGLTLATILTNKVTQYEGEEKTND